MLGTPSIAKAIQHATTVTAPGRSELRVSRSWITFAEMDGQSQRPLKRCSSKHFQQVVVVPTTTATFHDETRAVWILLQE